MEEKEKQICRLCLNSNSENQYQVFNETFSVMLDLLLPKRTLVVVKPYICYKCAYKLETSYNFRLKCLDNKDKLNNITNKFPENTQSLIAENECCLCFDYDCVFGEQEALSAYISLCVPELDLSIVNAVVVCLRCCDILKSTYMFVKMCIEIEEELSQYSIANKLEEIQLTHINNYLNNTKTAVENKTQFENEIRTNISTNRDSNNQIKTEIKEKSLQTFETMYLPEVKLDLVPTIETATTFSTYKSTLKTPSQTDDNCIGELNSSITIDNEPNIKATSEQFEPCSLGENGDKDNSKICTFDEGTLNITLTIYDVPKKGFSCKKCTFNALTKNELKYHFLTHRQKCKMYECKHCPFITRHKNVIDNHNLTHLADEEIIWYNCDKCTFRTKLQGNLEKHKFTHIKQSDELKKYRCQDCPYKTMWKRDLERHLLKHKPPGFACSYCIFSTKHERYLKQHIQRLHGTKEDSSSETFYCAQCSFTTKHKRSLIPHMVTHRKLDELQWYSCKFCDYKAKWKRSIKTHEEIHVEKYKCNHCNFQTTQKRFLKEHIRGHEPLPLYTCSHCDFSTSYKPTLHSHRVKHKNPDEIKIHQCPYCPYKTKRAADMRQHVSVVHAENTEELKCSICSYRTLCKKRLKHHEKMVHGESENITKFQCSFCSFQTKYKSSMLNHEIGHKKLDETSLIECPDCNYKTIRKDLLSRHILVHKNNSEVQMYECYHCTYKSKYKRALIKHVKGHQQQDSQKLDVLRCDKCDFKTKWANLLKKHLLSHPDIEVVKMEIDVSKTEIDWKDSGENCNVPDAQCS